MYYLFLLKRLRMPHVNNKEGVSKLNTLFFLQVLLAFAGNPEPIFRTHPSIVY